MKKGKTSYKKKDIDLLIKTTADMNSVCIYDTEYQKFSIRVFIDRKEEGEGVNLRDCERFLSTLKFLMNGHGIEDIPLEISSPGLERPLKKKWHFQSVLGQTIKIQMSTPLKYYDERMKKEKQMFHLKAQLHKCYEQEIILKKENQHFTIPFHQIKRANTVF